jgi:choline kinase
MYIIKRLCLFIMEAYKELFMQAVILAAGQGQRIRSHHTKPKGFIEINDYTLIDYSLEILRSYGITDIVIVTGYKKECYEKLAEETGWFDTVYNPEFATYGNLYSFYIARNLVRDDILLVESDIIFEPRAIGALLQSPNENAVLMSGPTQSNDEVYVEVENEYLVSMRKIKEELNVSKIGGEFTGLTRLSQQACQHLFELCEQDEAMLQQGYYDEAGLVKLAETVPIYGQLVEDLVWSEIDDVNQLERARLLFPKSPIAIGA